MTDREPRYYWDDDLDDWNVRDLTTSAEKRDLVGIVDEVDGGIIAYAIGQEHANRIVDALEGRAAR